MTLFVLFGYVVFFGIVLGVSLYPIGSWLNRRSENPKAAVPGPDELVVSGVVLTISLLLFFLTDLSYVAYLVNALAAGYFKVRATQHRTIDKGSVS